MSVRKPGQDDSSLVGESKKRKSILREYLRGDWNCLDRGPLHQDPVVDRLHPRRLLGRVHRADVLPAYTLALADDQARRDQMDRLGFAPPKR